MIWRFVYYWKFDILLSTYLSMINGQSKIVADVLNDSIVGPCTDVSNVTDCRMDLSNESIRYLPIVQTKTKARVRSLNLSRNFIGQYEALDLRWLAGWPSLRSLDLSRNRLSTLIGRGTELRSLSSLDVSHNRIFDLKPRMFSNMPGLKTLNLASNVVALISPSGLDLPNLLELDLSDNRLTTLRIHFFRDLRSLRSLKVRRNMISSVPSSVFVSCPSLGILDVSGNKIKKVSSEAFRNVRSLSLLDLSFNSMRSVPGSSLKIVDFIGDLSISHNPLATVRFEEVGVELLRICDVDSIYLVPEGAFVDLRSLRVLRVENNRNLRYVHPDSFRRVPNLTELYLTNNSLLTLHGRFVAQLLPSLSRLDLSKNDFRCDCSLNWLPARRSHDAFANLTVVVEDRCCDDDEIARDDRCEPFAILLGAVVVDGIAEPYESEYFDITCIASGLPEPSIEWLAPDDDDDGPTTVVVNCPAAEAKICQRDGRLSANSIGRDDEGVYTCRVSNEMGSENVSLELNVQRLNVTLSAVRISFNFVALHWVVRRPVRIVEDCVFVYRRRSGETTTTTTTTRSILKNCHHRRHYTLVDLEPDTEYNVTMYKKCRDRRLFVMDSIVVKTVAESLMQLLSLNAAYWILCSIVVLMSVPVLLICLLHCYKTIGDRLRTNRHSEMTVFTESESGSACFVLEPDDTSMSIVGDDDGFEY
ncbi:Uncharacterised protein r2_g1083 [Pycnogonum litorale]